MSSLSQSDQLPVLAARLEPEKLKLAVLILALRDREHHERLLAFRSAQRAHEIELERQQQLARTREETSREEHARCCMPLPYCKLILSEVCDVRPDRLTIVAPPRYLPGLSAAFA